MNIIFLHIPRTAGTSIGTQISEKFTGCVVCPAWDNGSLVELINTGQVSDYNLFSGHFHYDTVSRVPGENFIFTFLRNPISRFFSELNYMQNNFDLVLNHGCKSNMDLYDFYANNDIDDILNNAARFKITNRMCRHFQSDWEDCTSPYAFEIVVNKISSLNFVGTTESLAIDLEELSKLLGIKLDCCHMNYSSKSVAHANSVHIARLLDLFYYDIMLYRQFDRVLRESTPDCE